MDVAQKETKDSFIIAMHTAVQRQSVEEIGVVREPLKIAQPVKPRNPFLADGFGDELRERRIGLQKPAARRYAVGDIMKLLRTEVVEILKQAVLENL